MSDRNKLTVDDDSGDDDGEKEVATPTPRLRKGWKDPKDITAVGKFKTPSGNIREDM